jgi:phosphopantothenoylcysteine synthetase/decarboxylase
MKCLVTAGNTQVLIDKVRCITNIFSGRTGAQIALELCRRGHHVKLLTSRPESIMECDPQLKVARSLNEIQTYQTFEDLHQSMKKEIEHQSLDVIIHTAAVSDYLSEGVFAPATATHFDTKSLQFNGPARFKNVAAGKVKSDHDELWLRFVKAPKIIDCIRRDWGFIGKLVKFKLEVGITREQLEQIAEASRIQSKADLMVANTLESSKEWAILGPLLGKYTEISRAELASRLADALGL